MSAVEGKEELIEKLIELGKIDMQRALSRGGLIVENDAKKKAPHDTGELRRSITHYATQEECVIGTNLFYAPYLELGTGLWAVSGDGRKDVPWSYKDEEGNWHSTVGIHPHPYMGPALHDNRRKIEKEIAKEIERQLREIAKR